MATCEMSIRRICLPTARLERWPNLLLCFNYNQCFRLSLPDFGFMSFWNVSEVVIYIIYHAPFANVFIRLRIKRYMHTKTYAPIISDKIARIFYYKQAWNAIFNTR